MTNNFAIFIKSFLILIFLSLISLLFFYFATYDNKKNSLKNNKSETEENKPEIILQSFNLHQVSDKNYHWNINSEFANVYKKANKVNCENIVCNLLKDDFKIATIESKIALIDKNENQAYLYGPVNCFYPGIEFYTQNALVDLKSSTVTMTNGVRSIIEFKQHGRLRQP